MADQEEDFLAAERDAKFKKWLQNKTLRDKAFEYLAQISKSRAEEESSLLEVAVSLQAVDRLLGSDGSSSGGDDDNGNDENEPADNKAAKSSASVGQKTMKSVWAKWTMEHHNFERIMLTAKEVSGLSGGAKEFLEIQDDGTAEMPSLKFFYQQVPKQGEKARPLTNDQKLQNTIFMRECKRVWNEGATSLREQMKDGVANGGRLTNTKKSSSSANAESEAKTKASGETSSKDKDKDKEMPSRAAGGGGGGEGGGNVSSAKLEQKVLNNLSLRRLREWIEEDEDAELALKEEKKREKRKEAKKTHEMFTKVKAEKDERIREERRAERNSAESKAKARVEAEAKQLSQESFEKWVIQKEMRETSDKCLKLMPQPSLRRGDNAYTCAATREVIEVGRALKKIDRTLVDKWAKWAEDVVTFNNACTLWDAFEPIACDVHCAAHSVLKDSLSKVLTPGKDYKKFFEEYVKRHVRRTGGDDREEEDCNRAMNKLSLNRNQFMKALQDLGIIMKQNEIRMLVDAFDTNHDGVISLKEFLDFVNSGKPGSAALSNRCCWITTCKRTGMSNAFSVSEPTKKMLRKAGASSGEESKGGDSKEDDDDYGDDDDFDKDKGKSGNGNGKDKGLTVIRELANGDKRICVELIERRRREALLDAYGVLSPSNAADDKYDDEFDEYGDEEKSDGGGGGSSKNCCSFSKWSNDNRKSGLSFLIEETRGAREEEALKKMLSEGEPPKAPEFSVARTYSGGNSTELNLVWDPSPGDLVSFFCVETSGPTGGSKESKYSEIFRDPPSADSRSSFAYNFTMKDLQPGTSYQFRIRGFNGFGPGEYTYRIFTTRTDAPPAPRTVKLAADSVTLRWMFSETFYARMEELAGMFRRMDVDNSGTVSRDELADAIDEKASASSHIRSFLLKKADSIGVDITNGCGALFDVIEGDDNGNLSWEEFESFFLSLGWADARASQSQSMAASQARGSVLSLSGARGSSGSGSKQSDVTYVVEQCENEFDGSYKQVLKTGAGHGTISRLEPGSSYRFRVYSVNVAGIPGPKSEEIIVHTLIETPAAPLPTYIGSNIIALQWKARNHSASMRDPNTVNKLLTDWTGNHDGAEGGVSIEMAFARYDKDQSGDIDAAELACMLEDLGVEVTEERLAEAFSILDSNGDGVITFEEFADWWRRDEVSYTVKRSDPIGASTKNLRVSISDSAAHAKLGAIAEEKEAKEATLGKSGGKSKTIGFKADKNVPLRAVVYRGEGTRFDVGGLAANRLYYFKLRLMGPRCNSSLSQPMVIMSAPNAPARPVLVDVGSTTVRVKWYAPTNGAHKYAVQLRKKLARLTTTAINALNDSMPGAAQGWVTVFNGQETIWTSTTMVPAAEYEVRVLGLNYQGTPGEASAPAAFTTLSRDEKGSLGSKDAESQFAIECSGDLCVGDTVLITERLFVKDSQSNQTLANDLAQKSITSRGKGSVRMDMSVTSLPGGSESGLLPPGAYIGERTIAAHVIKDNYRTARDGLTAKGLTPRDHKKFGKHRYVWLEVIWQRASSEACKPFELKKGEVIERSQAALEEFEVFRTGWGESENLRLGLGLEWASLGDSFTTSECDPSVAKTR